MNINNMRIRIASPEDAQEILDIYTPYVKNTAITFEYDVPSLEDFHDRISNTLQKYPYLVAVIGDEIVGYSYTGALKSRAAYDWAVESTIYVKENKKHMGIGKILYQEIEKISIKQNVFNIYACVAFPITDDIYLNRNSAQFHEHMGYSVIGEFHKCGYKFGRWYNMVWMEKIIGKHIENPGRFIPFKELEVIDL